MTPELTPERTPQHYEGPRRMQMPRQLPPPAPVPASVPARPHVARPAGRLGRMFTHAFLFLIGAHLLAMLAKQTSAPGYASVMRTLAPGAYAPLAVAMSAALHAQRGIVLVLVALIVIGIWPFTIDELATWLIPVGAGIMLGRLIQWVALESHGEAP